MIAITVGINGHSGTIYFVLYSEVVLSFEVKMY